MPSAASRATTLVYSAAHGTAAPAVCIHTRTRDASNGRHERKVCGDTNCEAALTLGLVDAERCRWLAFRSSVPRDSCLLRNCLREDSAWTPFEGQCVVCGMHPLPPGGLISAVCEIHDQGETNAVICMFGVVYVKFELVAMSGLVAHLKICFPF